MHIVLDINVPVWFKVLLSVWLAFTGWSASWLWAYDRFEVMLWFTGIGTIIMIVSIWGIL